MQVYIAIKCPFRKVAMVHPKRYILWKSHVCSFETLCLFSEHTQLSEQSLLFQNNMSFAQRLCPSIFHSHQLNPTIPHMNGEWLFFVKFYGQVCDHQAKTDCIWISEFSFEFFVVNMHRMHSVNR